MLSQSPTLMYFQAYVEPLLINLPSALYALLFPISFFTSFTVSISESTLRRDDLLNAALMGRGFGLVLLSLGLLEHVVVRHCWQTVSQRPSREVEQFIERLMRLVTYVLLAGDFVHVICTVLGAYHKATYFRSLGTQHPDRIWTRFVVYFFVGQLFLTGVCLVIRLYHILRTSGKREPLDRAR